MDTPLVVLHLLFGLESLLALRGRAFKFVLVTDRRVVRVYLLRGRKR